MNLQQAETPIDKAIVKELIESAHPNGGNLQLLEVVYSLEDGIENSVMLFQVQKAKEMWLMYQLNCLRIHTSWLLCPPTWVSVEKGYLLNYT